MSEPKFSLGQVVATPGALHELERLTGKSSQSVAKLLRRHISGDWGDVDPQDAKANDLALAENTRILSVYTVDGVKFWIITEADRSSTCLLLPEEY